MDKSRAVSAVILSALASVGSISQARIHQPIYLPERSCFDGFYVGVGGGGVLGDLHASSTTQSLVTPSSNADSPRATFIEQHESHPNHFLGTAFIGFGNVIYRAYEGIELWGTIGSNDSFGFAGSKAGVTKSMIQEVTPSFITRQGTHSLTTTVTRVNYPHNLEGGVDGKLGWLLTPTTLLYGRAGVGFNKFEFVTTSFVVGTSTVPDFVTETGVLSYKVHKNVDYRFGAGLEQHFSHHWSLRADYIFTHYGWLGGFKSITPSPSESLNLRNPDFLRNVTRASLNNSAVLLSLLYTFN